MINFKTDFYLTSSETSVFSSNSNNSNSVTCCVCTVNCLQRNKNAPSYHVQLVWLRCYIVQVATYTYPPLCPHTVPVSDSCVHAQPTKNTLHCYISAYPIVGKAGSGYTWGRGILILLRPSSGRPTSLLQWSSGWPSFLRPQGAFHRKSFTMPKILVPGEFDLNVHSHL